MPRTGDKGNGKCRGMLRGPGLEDDDGWRKCRNAENDTDAFDVFCSCPPRLCGLLRGLLRGPGDDGGIVDKGSAQTRI